MEAVHGVTIEEVHAALQRSDWNPVRAEQQLKVGRLNVNSVTFVKSLFHPLVDSVLVLDSSPPFSWSSCTCWASAPEKTAWGSSPDTSGTCSWPAATCSDGRRRRGPARATGSLLVWKDESEGISSRFLFFCIFSIHKRWLEQGPFWRNYGNRWEFLWVEKISSMNEKTFWKTLFLQRCCWAHFVHLVIFFLMHLYILYEKWLFIE